MYFGVLNLNPRSELTITTPFYFKLLKTTTFDNGEFHCTCDEHLDISMV